jgi:hypothetical protein
MGIEESEATEAILRQNLAISFAQLHVSTQENSII